MFGWGGGGWAYIQNNIFVGKWMGLYSGGFKVGFYSTHRQTDRQTERQTDRGSSDDRVKCETAVTNF